MHSEDTFPLSPALCDKTLTVADKIVALTPNEARVMALLIERRGEIVSRADLMIALWQSDVFIENNTLTVCMARLRRKLENHGLPGLLQTKTGKGYYLI